MMSFRPARATKWQPVPIKQITKQTNKNPAKKVWNMALSLGLTKAHSHYSLNRQSKSHSSIHRSIRPPTHASPMCGAGIPHQRRNTQSPHSNCPEPACYLTQSRSALLALGRSCVPGPPANEDGENSFLFLLTVMQREDDSYFPSSCSHATSPAATSQELPKPSGRV